MKILVLGTARSRDRHRVQPVLDGALDRFGCEHLVTVHTGILPSCAKRWLRERPDVQHTNIVTYRNWAGVRAPATTIAYEVLTQHKPDLVLAFWPSGFHRDIVTWLAQRGMRIAVCTQGMRWMAPELHRVEK